MNTKLAPHETLELRELLSGEINGVKKLNTAMPMVHDDDLKSYMQKCLDGKKDNIKIIQEFVNSELQMK